MIFPMNAETTNKIYPNREELLEDVAKIYRAFIKQLYDAGCRNLQLDDCSWGVLLQTPPRRLCSAWSRKRWATSWISF